MEGGAVGHNFERDTPRDHLCQVWLHLAKLFQRRRKTLETFSFLLGAVTVLQFFVRFRCPGFGATLVTCGMVR
jgi:hypothetical protein